MTINELKLKIIQGNLDNLFVFYGEEHTVQSIYIHKIAEAKGADLEYIDTIEESFNSDGGSLFGDVKCYVCVDPVELLKSSDLDKDFAKITQKLGLNSLILQFSKLDKRSKLYNFCQRVGVEFEHLHPIVLTKHLKDVLDISPVVANKLIEICDNDYGRCLLELDKVKRCGEENPNKAFQILLESGTIYQPPQDKIFDFVGAVLAGKPKLAFTLLQECVDIGEPPLRLLSVLFTNIKHLLQVQSCERNVEETTGLTSWEIRNVQKYIGVYRNSELVNLMKLIRKAEQGIKSGKLDEEIAMDYVLVNTF